MPDARLSEAEYAIMQQFWADGPMGSDGLAALAAARGWKPTTLLTFLSRLAAKGMLAVEKRGKSNLYRPLVGRAAYQGDEGRAFLDERFGGSARNFVAAMVDAQTLTTEELRELRQWLDRKEVPEDD